MNHGIFALAALTTVVGGLSAQAPSDPAASVFVPAIKTGVTAMTAMSLELLR